MLTLNLTTTKPIKHTIYFKQDFNNSENTSNIKKPRKTVIETTSNFIKNNTKSPTEFMAATRSAFEVIILKACCPELQKLSP